MLLEISIVEPKLPNPSTERMSHPRLIRKARNRSHPEQASSVTALCDFMSIHRDHAHVDMPRFFSRTFPGTA